MKKQVLPYHERVKGLNYRKAILEHVRRLADPRYSILDIGSAGCDTCNHGAYGTRHAVNLHPLDSVPPGIRHFYGAWPKIDLPLRKYDVVVCSQVIEHLRDEEMAPFVQRLHSDSNHLIVSVPYLWEKGKCLGHLQDPIDLVKFVRLLEKNPVEIATVADKGFMRLVAYFK